MATSILVIDDDANYTKLLERKLRSFLPNLELQLYQDLKQARQSLTQMPAFRYDLVILDEHLPDGRGLDLLNEEWFEGMLVLSISSDNSPETVGNLVKAGAAFFLNKTQITDPLFAPLVLGLIDRNRMQKALEQAKLDKAMVDTVRTLVATLRHEINNPLGAVLGAAYILRSNSELSTEQREAADLVEASGKRIKHVLEQLSDTMALQSVSKASHKVFQVPGDKPWED